MSHHLTTERLVLRPFERTDATRLAELVNDIEIARWIGPMPHPYTADMAHTYLDDVIPDRGTFALTLNSALVGAVGIGRMLGFWLARDHWCKGLMTEACTAMIARHFDGGAASLTSGYHYGNAASARVHAKLGFAAEGTSQVFSQALQKDVLRHDLILTRDAWQDAA